MFDDLTDTAPDVHQAQEAVWSRLEAEGRIRLMLQLSDELREVALDGIRRREPDLTETQARGRLLRTLLGDDLYAAAYVARGRLT
jgi:hypothetical protein